MKRIVFLSLLSLLCSTAFSQTQLEMNTEAYKNYIAADKKMTSVYKKTLKEMTDPQQRQLLIQAQREWIRYKEAHCKSVAGQYEGGSMKPMVYSECLAELTKERTEKLKSYSN